MMEASKTPSPEAPKHQDRLTKRITFLVAVIAASTVVCGFLNNLESGRVSQETRTGLAAQSLSSERSLEVGRIFDADFDYINTAEVHTFLATELEAQSLVSEAERERAVAMYLLRSTYGYGDSYYSDMVMEDAVYRYNVAGFDNMWAAFSTYAGTLQADVDAKRAMGDAHLAAANDAGQRATGFMLSAVLMAVAVALGTVALVTEAKVLRYSDLVVIAILYALGWANLAWTFVS